MSYRLLPCPCAQQDQLMMKEINHITIAPFPLLTFMFVELRTPSFFFFFSNPRYLINFLEIVFFTYQPHWD